MNRGDIIRMAREAGCEVYEETDIAPALVRFAALVAAHEREACAMVAEEYWYYSGREVFSINIAVREIAEKIRARSE